VGRTREALYTKHSQGQKVKGQSHKVMRRSSKVGHGSIFADPIQSNP